MDTVVQKSNLLGYSKKEDVSKIIFIKEIWKPAVDHQHFEMAKAVINQSSEYRLSQEAAYLPVPIELWYTWSKIRRNKYINYIRNLSKSDLEDHKTLKTDMWYDESDLSSVKKALSLKLPEFLPNIPHTDIIEEKALDLLNIPNAITLSPTLLATNKEKIYFFAGKTYRENYKINVSASAVIKCSCKGFRFSNICSHSVAVSEKEGILEKHLRKFKSSRSKSSSFLS